MIVIVLAETTSQLAGAAESAAATLCVAFSVLVAPAVFRLVPPDAAGRVFSKLSRAMLFAAMLLAIAATAARTKSADPRLAASILDGFASATLGAVLSVMSQFERARAVALREPGLGSGVEGAAVLRSHRLLGGMRMLTIFAAIQLAAAFTLSLLKD